MGARRNIIVLGLNSIVTLAPPVFAGPSGRRPVDYFMTASQYLGKGFKTAIGDEKANQSNEEHQLLLEIED